MERGCGTVQGQVDASFNLYAQVILNNNSKSTDRIYTYGVRSIHAEDIAVGKRVKVMFGSGKKPLDAVVIHLSAECSLDPSKVKPVEEIIDDAPVIRENLIKIALWMRERYICKYSDVIRLMIPSAIKFEHKVFIKPTGIEYEPIDDREAEFLQMLGAGMEIDKLKKVYIETDIYAVIKRLEDKGAIETRSREQSYRRGSHEMWVKLVSPPLPLKEYGLSRAPKQEAVVEYLLQNKEARVETLKKDVSTSQQIINSLIQKGVVESSMKLASLVEADSCGSSRVSLNDEQQRAFDSIISSKGNVFCCTASPAAARRKYT